MSWFKICDTLALHPKTMSAGNAAMGLWVRSGAWSMQNLTDGFVPLHIVRVLGTRRQADRLLEARLWAYADRGFQFHNWTDWQRPAEIIREDRIIDNTRKRLGRERKNSEKIDRIFSQCTTEYTSGPQNGFRPE